MSYRLVIFFLVAILVNAAPAQAAKPADRIYLEGSNVTLSGHAERVWEFGPPNYGEAPDSDSIEHYIVLILDRPIIIKNSHGDKLENVLRVQLALERGDGSKLWTLANELIDKKTLLVVTGENRMAINGHDHEPVTLFVSKICPKQ